MWQGVAFGRPVSAGQEKDTLVLENMNIAQFNAIWKNYFDLNRCYGDIKKLLSRDPVMERAVAYAPGLRVLCQEPWEALCSFIFSQNNNIPRIKGIVERFCDAFGEKREGISAFPAPETVANLTVEDMAEVRAGFRAKYILDAARKVSSGEVDLKQLAYVPTDQAREVLMRIHGVGPKVADCALLYGLGHVDAFPADVWINRAVDTFFPSGFPALFRPVAGIAQQYLFHYARNNL